MKPGGVVIVGQGLAGSLLGWSCECAEIPFRIVDRGHGEAASRVGAGILNPLTGRRLVPTWRFAEWRDQALAQYRELERRLSLSLVSELPLFRRYRDAAERERWATRIADPAVRAWIRRQADDGIELVGAAQVNTSALIAGLRTRWQARGWLIDRELNLDRGPEEPAGLNRNWPAAVAASLDMAEAPETIVWCTGGGIAPGFAWVPREHAKGEIVTGELAGAAPAGLVNDGHWVLPIGGRRVRVGATYDRTAPDCRPSLAARSELEAAALRLGGSPLHVTEHDAAVRVTTPDRRPFIGAHPALPSWEIFSGLGSKGALWAPVLAEQWWRARTQPLLLEREAAVSRFWR